MYDIIYKIESIVRECGHIMLSRYDDLDIEEKDGVGNLVTKYDKLIQNRLKDELLKLIPTASFFGEEGKEENKILENGYTFIVDPIDGTFNFTRDIKLSAISVALLKDSIPYISVCFNPYINEMYLAQKDKGAYLNNKKIVVSDKKLASGLLLFGSSPYNEELHNKSFELLNKVGKHCLDIRRTGSAVIDLCSIASGKAEIYFELTLSPWDYAGGYLLVVEAGGIVTDINGNDIRFDKPCSIIATNKREDYLKYFNEDN